MATQRGGRPWRRVQAQVRAEEPCCHLCGLRVDLALPRYPHADPLSSVIDHLRPVHLGGTNERQGLRHSHACCNKLRGISTVNDDVRAACRAHVDDLIAQRGGSPNIGSRSRDW